MIQQFKSSIYTHKTLFQVFIKDIYLGMVQKGKNLETSQT